MADIEIAKEAPESPTIVPAVPELGPPPPAGPAVPPVVLASASTEQKVVEPMDVAVEVRARTGWRLYAILSSLFVSPPISRVPTLACIDVD